MAKFTPRAQTEANDDGLKEKMIAVTHHRQCGEAERAAALDDLGDAVDRDHLFLEAVVVGFGLGAGSELCHLVFLEPA